jgi:hypothetical protein
MKLNQDKISNQQYARFHVMEGEKKKKKLSYEFVIRLILHSLLAA